MAVMRRRVPGIPECALRDAYRGWSPKGTRRTRTMLFSREDGMAPMYRTSRQRAGMVMFDGAYKRDAATRFMGVSHGYVARHRARLPSRKF
jgi:hypothetical protein